MIAEDGGQERADGEVLASSLAILDPTTQLICRVLRARSSS